jgi:hypothetical protein
MCNGHHCQSAPIPWELYGKETVQWHCCGLTLVGNMIQGCGSHPKQSNPFLLQHLFTIFHSDRCINSELQP